MIVEHYPDFIWARDICAKQLTAGEEIELSGYEVFSSDEAKSAHDLVREYREARRVFGNQKRAGKNAPHIQFANAGTDEDLFKFAERFGPVICSTLRTEEVILKDEFDLELSKIRLIAQQNLAELRNERKLYRAALTLVSVLGRGNKPDLAIVQQCIEQIYSGVLDWPWQWEREHRLRKKIADYDKPAWTFTKQDVESVGVDKFYADNHGANEPLAAPDALSSAHSALCTLINAFEVRLYLWGDHAVEAPHWNLRGGIRPLLYYILRREYLKGSGIEICRNSDCRQVFEIERAGQEFCSDLCSRRQRQREYWVKSGKKKRARRLRSAKKAKRQI